MAAEAEVAERERQYLASDDVWAGMVAERDADIERLQGIIEGMAARIASQSDQLSRRAMKNTNAEGSD